MWIEAKVVKEQNESVISFDLGQFECELCKKSIPSTIRVKEKVVSMVEWAEPDGPYVVLESASVEHRMLYLVRLDREVVVGRQHTAQVNMRALNDATISRQHCSIRYENGQIILRDLKSRFGTLILLQKRITFSGPMCLQANSRHYKLEPIVPQKRLRTESYARPNSIYQPRELVYA